MTKAERAAEMSRVRKLGVKRSKTKARALRQNAEVSDGGVLSRGSLERAESVGVHLAHRHKGQLPR
jgi:hypothetical protein